MRQRQDNSVLTSAVLNSVYFIYNISPMSYLHKVNKIEA